MIYAINGAMLALSSSLTASLLTKATLIITIAFAGTWLARGSRAAARHAILAASFAALLALPAASLLIPTLRIAVARQPIALPPIGRAIDVTQASSLATDDAVAASSVRQRTERKIPLYELLFAGWMAGAAVFGLRMIVGLREVYLLRRSGLPWRDGQAVVDWIASGTGVHRHLEVLLDESLPTPVTCSIFRPAIVLPCDAQNWDSEDLKRAITHELEHVRRGDWVTQCIARAVCAAYWFHPLVWVAWRRLSLEAERACDDAVLRHSEATAYAGQLVGLAKRLSVAQRSPLLAMANRADLAMRVGALLDGRQRRGRVGKLSLALTCVAAAMLVLWLSPVSLVAAPQAASQQAQSAFEVASIRVSKSDSPGAKFAPGPRSFEAEGATLRDLVLEAYGLKDFQVLGGPGWINADRFDVQAKGGDPAGAGAGRRDTEIPKLQTLLQERFRLVIHRETKGFSIYELTVAKGGLKLQPLKDGACVPRDPAARGPGKNPLGICGYLGYGRGTFEAANMSMPELANAFARLTGRPVVDKTGIAGIFRIQLTYTPDESLTYLAGPVPTNPDGPGLFTAMQEQLGLKLEPAKGPVPVVVIDSVERPSEN